MSSSWLTDLQAWLDAQDLGTTGTDLFIHTLPDTEGAPLEGMVLTPTGGQPARPNTSTITPTVQLMARYNDPSTAFAKAWEAHDLLEGATFHQGSTVFRRVRAIQPPADFPRDESGRYFAVVSFVLTIS